MTSHDLDRFLSAQQGVYEQALAEIRGRRKQSHWMWFIFPQIAGLGFSEMSRYFAIRNRSEAEAYLAHPVLGARLRECAQAVLDAKGRSATEIFGSVDAMKLRSSATLFAAVSSAGSVFHRIIDDLFEGRLDEKTTQFLDD